MTLNSCDRFQVFCKKDKSACLNGLNITRGKYERRVSSNAAKVLAAAGILNNNVIISSLTDHRDENGVFAFGELRKDVIKIVAQEELGSELTGWRETTE